jgi:hypothetical protein
MILTTTVSLILLITKVIIVLELIVIDDLILLVVSLSLQSFESRQLIAVILIMDPLWTGSVFFQNQNVLNTMCCLLQI